MALPAQAREAIYIPSQHSHPQSLLSPLAGGRKWKEGSPTLPGTSECYTGPCPVGASLRAAGGPDTPTSPQCMDRKHTGCMVWRGQNLSPNLTGATVPESWPNPASGKPSRANWPPLHGTLGLLLRSGEQASRPGETCEELKHTARHLGLEGHF